MRRRGLAAAIAGKRSEGIEWLGALATPSMAVQVGDPFGSSPARIEVGVSACDAFIMGSDEEASEDGVVLGLRMRTTPAVRWGWGPGVGVDSGVLGVWNADDPATEEGAPKGALGPGFERLRGRVVLASETGDGGFPCVLGHDETSALSVLLVGDGVAPERYGLSDEDTAVIAPQEGEPACAVTRALVAPFLSEPAHRARAERALAARSPAPLGADERATKALYEARVSVVVAWGLRLWARLIRTELPVVAEELAGLKVPARMKQGWSAPLFSVLKGALGDLEFDRWAPFREQLAALTVEQLTERQRTLGIQLSYLTELERELDAHVAPALLPSGVCSMNAMSTLPLSAEKKDALWCVKTGLTSTLRILALRERTKDRTEFSVSSPLLLPRSADYLVESILVDGDALSLIDPLASTVPRSES
jgi:hypothetical protein